MSKSVVDSQRWPKFRSCALISGDLGFFAVSTCWHCDVGLRKTACSAEDPLAKGTPLGHPGGMYLRRHNKKSGGVSYET